MAYMDGTGRGDDPNVVPIALARLEKLIQVRLAQSLELGDGEPVVTVKVFESGPDGNMPSIQEDPQFYDAVVDKIVSTLDAYLDEVDEDDEPLSASALNEKIETAFVSTDPAPPHCDTFVGRLRCHKCGQVTQDASAGCETFLRDQPDGTVFSVGSHFAFDPVRIARDYYAYAMSPARDESVHIIEGWECPGCSAVNWAEICVRDEIVESVWSVALSRDTLERAHYVTSECVELAAQITGRPAWSLLGDDVFEILFDRL